MTGTTAVLKGLQTLFTTNGVILPLFPTWNPSPNVTKHSYYADVAPAKAPFPYVVYGVVSAPSVSVYGRAAFQEPYIRFTVYQIGQAAAMALADSVIGVLDEYSIPLPTGQLLLTDRTVGPIPKMDSKLTDGTGREVWGVTFVYHFAA